MYTAVYALRLTPRQAVQGPEARIAQVVVLNPPSKHASAPPPPRPRPGGLERTAEEYAALFRAAGWTPGPVIATPGPMALHFAHAA